MGRPGRLPKPVGGYIESLPADARELLDHVLSCAAIGTPEAVGTQMQEFIARTGADELIITGNMYDYAARLHSYEIVAGLM